MTNPLGHNTQDRLGAITFLSVCALVLWGTYELWPWSLIPYVLAVTYVEWRNW